MANLHLLCVPHVVQTHILSFMTIQEQLKLRLVCKTIKAWVDRDAHRLAEHIPASALVHRGRETFRNFCGTKSRILHRISNVEIENESLDIYEDQVALSEFLEHHSNSMKRIRLKRYFINGSNEGQIRFLESFPNLEELEMDEIWVANSDYEVDQLPAIFRNLKVLKLGFVYVYNEPGLEIVTDFSTLPVERKKIIRWLPWDLLRNCNKLTYLRVPICPRGIFDSNLEECLKLLNFIRLRTSFKPPGSRYNKNPIMQCDLENFACCASSVEIVLVVGSRMKIQFLNVNTRVLRRGTAFNFSNTPPGARKDYLYSFISSSLIYRRFEFVQKITIKGSLIQNECILGREKGPRLFPALKEIMIILDIGLDMKYSGAEYSVIPSRNGEDCQTNVCFPRADQVLKFFFPEGAKYKLVHTLGLAFAKPVFPFQRRANPGRLASLPSIIEGLPKVRNLHISGWNGNRDTYLQLWKGFPLLQKLTLDNCSTLNASCFIDGNGNPNNPENFSCLSGLVFLELKGLANMPGMSNRSAFGMDVFDKMGLVPFDFLTRTESQHKTAAWIRPASTSAFSLKRNSVIVTRSMSKGVKRQRLV